ncbi:MAG: sirohydrochlorin chelatase [Corynebacterium sp.]|nr:sirohydrochlorin chelatase [Corynebacterium sp.]
MAALVPSFAAEDPSGLILLAHGSRHPQVAEHISKITSAASRSIARGEKGAQVHVASAYLDHLEPALPQVAHKLADAGIRRATVIPLLFTRGFHTRVDVPNVIAQAATSSGVDLILTPGLGTGREMCTVLERKLAADLPIAGGIEKLHVIVLAVGSKAPQANAEVKLLAPALQEKTGCRVSAVFVSSAGQAPSQPHGIEALRLYAANGSRIHLLPLFVTEGLLLDRFIAAAKEMGAHTKAHISFSTPLGDTLASVVARRFAAGQRKIRAPDELAQRIRCKAANF